MRMASCGGLKRKRKLWGESKEDLIPVKIFCRESSHVDFSETNLKQVTYKSCSSKCLKKREVFFYPMRKDVSTDIEALQSLKTELRHLEKMEFTRKRGEIYWSVDEEEEMPSIHSLCCQIMLAFMGGLKDTDAKNAMVFLISQMMQLLGRNELVKMTGSSSHVSRYSTSYELLMEQTTSSSNEGTSKKESDKPACCTPTSKLTPGSTSPASSTDSGECQAPKLSTADVLVYSQPLLEQPIITKLAVSLKSHVKATANGILKELLSRIPYQTGHIFGLEINPRMAKLFSVYEYSEQLVIIYHHHPFEFTCFDEKTGKLAFNFDSFWNMVLAIGHVLHE